MANIFTKEFINLLTAITLALVEAFKATPPIVRPKFSNPVVKIQKNPNTRKGNTGSTFHIKDIKGLRKPGQRDFTSGKLMSSSENYSENEEKKFEITPDQDALICGSLLGDAHIQKRGNSYRLKFAHSEKQQEYVRWKYNKLASLCQTTQGVTKRVSNKNQTVYEFYTSSTPELKKYHDLFYKKEETFVNGTPRISYRKTITNELINSLPKNKYTLATFYMDDGSARSDCYSARFATQGFSKNECHLLQKYFGDTWDLKTNVVLHSRKKNSYSLAVPAKTFPKFRSLVEEVVCEIPEMEYKLNEKNKNKSFFSKE